MEYSDSLSMQNVVTCKTFSGYPRR